MIKQLWHLSILGLALAAPPKHRIVGGSPIDISEVPYQVAVGNQSSIWCGGSIIDKRWILTAAHCFDDHDVDSETFNVLVGMTRLDAIDPSMVKDVKKVIVHPDYDAQSLKKDIAVLELVEVLKLSNDVQLVELPFMNERVPIASFAYASGWGGLAENDPASIQLQGVSLQLLPAFSCDVYERFDTTYMQCAGALDGSVDTCQGDSGGPLVYNGVIYGVVSFGNGCAVIGFPGVYANVANLRDFITNVTGL